MENAENLWQRSPEYRGNFTTAKIACGQDENSRLACSQRANLQWAISQPPILCEHNPAARSCHLEPHAIFLISCEMVVVNLDGEPCIYKFRPDWLQAKRPVDKEHGAIKRLRSGWLLRLH